MAFPEIARNLKPRGGPVIAPGAWPVLSGYVRDAETYPLTVFARLWSDRNECVWVRPMIVDSALDVGYYRYQTLGPGTSETKTFTFGAGATGGAWAFKYHDVRTDMIPFGYGTTGAVAAQARLEHHPDFNRGHISCSYSGRTLTVTFTGERAGLDIDSLFVSNALTGSGDTSITGSTTMNGSGDFPVSDGGRGHWFWDMIATDGTTYAGGVTTQRDADAPGLAEFWIDDPLVLTMSFPNPDVITTVGGTAVPFAWTVSNIGKVPLRQTDLNIVDDFTNEIVDIDAYGSWVSTDRSVREYRLPYQRIVGNGTTWRWNLRVTADSGLQTNRYGTLRLLYTTPPTPVNTSATLGGKAGIEYADLAWSIDADAGFVDHVIRVRPAGSISRGRADRVVWFSSDRSETTYRLRAYAFNIDQIVSISQRAVRNGQIVESNPAELTIAPYGDMIMISEREHSPYQPRTLVIRGHDGRSIEPTRGPEYLDILNRQHPIVVNAGVGRPRGIAVTMRMQPNDRNAQRAEWQLAQSFMDNALKKTFLYRDALGEVLVVALDSAQLDHGPGDPAPRIDIRLRTINAASVVLPADAS